MSAILGTMPELSERDRAILAFEEQWPRQSAAKEAAVRVTFLMSGARYYQLVNRLIERPEALQAEPILVKRLLRQRDDRLRRRSKRSP